MHWAQNNTHVNDESIKTYLNTQDRQVRHNTYTHIFGTKPNMQMGK